MAPGRKRILLLATPLLVFGVLLVVLFQGLGRDPTLLPSARQGKPLPAFTAQRVGEPGSRVTNADLGGQAYLLNVWATWCPTCRAEHEMLNTLKAQGVRIVGVNYKDDPAAAVAWLQQLGNPYVINIDDQSGQLGIELGVYGAPETFLVDADGIVRYRHVGAVDETVWREALQPRYRELAKDAPG